MKYKLLSLFLVSCLLGSSSDVYINENNSNSIQTQVKTEAAISDDTFSKSNWMEYPYIRQSLTHMRELIQTKRVWHGQKVPSSFSYDLKSLDSLPVKGEKEDSISLQSMLIQTHTDGFLVMYKGKIVYEKYFNGMQPQDQHWTASITKVLTGLLVSLLAEEERISLSAKASTYIPELKGTPFGNASVQQLMDMQVSTAYPTYGYDDSKLGNQDTMLFLASDILPRGNHYEGPMTIYDMLKEAKQDKPTGTVFAYNNGSAETLGWIIRRVTGQSLAKIIEDRIWTQLTPEEDAYYISDQSGIEEASAGFNGTLRDLARFGEMILQNGVYNGKRILPENIFTEIKRGVGTEPVKKDTQETAYSYHNLWWLTNNEDKAFEVTGSFGQQLYIDPKAKMVVVHFSSNADTSTSPVFENAYLKIAQFLTQSKK